jgi:hypothetical protein
MKKYIIVIIAVLFSFLDVNVIFAATDSWTQKADFGGGARADAVGFSIGSKGYVGTAMDSLYHVTKDFWEFDPATNIWTQNADLGETERTGAVGFSIGSKGYIGTGLNDKDFWEYDAVANTWIQKADFGGGARTGAVGFSIGSKGYVGTGTNMSGNVNIWDSQGTVLSASIVVDENNVFEPTVIYDTNPQILTTSTYVFKMWFTSGWNSVGINYAESTDGISWTRYPSVVVAGHDRSFVFKSGSTYYLYATPAAMNQIDLYTSVDGVTWVLDIAAVLTLGTSWDSAYLANMCVWIEGTNEWKMLYEAQSGGSWSIGLATSSDGRVWTKSASNPVFTGAGSYGGPDIHRIGSNYYLWLHASAVAGLPTDIYGYNSTDMISWIQSPSMAVLSRTTWDEGPNTSYGQVADVSLVEANGKTYLFYSASPNGTTQNASAHIKLAIADMLLTELAATNYNGSWSLYKDFWEYDPVANIWTQKANFAGTGRRGAVGFSIGSKGYIGTGNDESGHIKDFWEYDPTANIWTQKADFGGGVRETAVGFSIGRRGYIGTGYDNSYSKTKDFWEYDPVANTWTRKADFGGTARDSAVGFSIGSRGYIGMGEGYDGSYSMKSDFWEYNPGVVKNDFNGDGHTDLFWRNPVTGENVVYYMDGVTILSGVYLPTIDPAWTLCGTSDLNTDGKPDLFWRNPTTGENVVYYMDGVTILSGVYLPTIDPAWTLAGIADLNNDGKPDLLWRNPVTGQNVVYYMDGVNIVSGAYLPTIDPAWTLAGTADLNTDGKPDLLWRNPVTGQNVVYYMDGVTILSGVYLPTIDPAWTLAGTADLNSDGNPDFLWRNPTTGENVVYYMNGVTILSGAYLPTIDPVWTLAGH